MKAFQELHISPPTIVSHAAIISDDPGSSCGVETSLIYHVESSDDDQMMVTPLVTHRSSTASVGDTSSPSAIPETPVSTSSSAYPFPAGATTYENKPIMFSSLPNRLNLATVHRDIKKIFKTYRLDPPYFMWSKMSFDVKIKYFNELQKIYYVPDHYCRDIWKCFDSTAARLYSQYVNMMKLGYKGERPPYLDEAEWQLWLTHWDDDDIDKIATQSSDSHLKEPTDGSGLHNTNHLGFQSIVVAQSRAAWEKLTNAQLMRRSKFKDGK